MDRTQPKQVIMSGWAAVGAAIVGGMTIVFLYGLFWLGMWIGASQSQVDNTEKRLGNLESGYERLEDRITDMDTRITGEIQELQGEIRGLRETLEGLPDSVKLRFNQ